MKSTKVWSGITALLVLVPAAAQASIFRAPVPATVTTKPGKERLKRLAIGAYYSQWDVASIRLGGRNVDFDVSGSPLLSADYFLNKRLSIGGWFSPIDFEGQVGPGRRGVVDGKLNFWDVHATYYLPKGWSAQAGISHISQELRLTRDIPVRNEPGAVIPRGTKFEDDRGGANLWLTKSHRVIGGRRPLDAYGSLGYYADPDFDYAYSAIAGLTYGLTDDISLSSSLWWFNLQGKVETRLNVGVVGRF